MNDGERNQVDAIVDREVLAARTKFAARLEQLETENSGRKIQRPDFAVRVEIGRMDEISRHSAASLVEQVSMISASSGALALVSSAMKSILDEFGAQLPAVLSLGKKSSGASVRNALELFREMRAKIEADIAIYGFDLRNPCVVTSVPVAAATSDNKAGRPLADHWDEVWASIAWQLHDGQLDPKTQADIENAMADVLHNLGRSAAPSSVRKRARVIWGKFLRAP